MFFYTLSHSADNMDKACKLNMFYHLADAQGIRATVNNVTCASALTPLAATAPVSDLSPTLVVVALDPVLELYHLVGTIATLSVNG